jgi:hypothetical protein
MLQVRKSCPIASFESLSPLHERDPTVKINKARTIKMIKKKKETCLGMLSMIFTAKSNRLR